MESELKRKWIEALRSGEYEQGQDQLICTLSREVEEYCCLGVLADIMDGVVRDGDDEFLFPLDGVDLNILLWDDDEDRLMDKGEWQGDDGETIVASKIVAETMIPTPIADLLGLRVLVNSVNGRGETSKKELRNHLAHLNDNQGKSFAEIADYLESIDF